MNIIEKIITSHSNKTKVKPGDIVDIEIDARVARDFGGPNVVKNLEEHYLDVADTGKTFFTFDTNPTGSDQKYAVNQQIVRVFARKHGIKVFDIDNGIGTHTLFSEGLSWPGSTAVTTDSHANILGAIGAFGQGMGDKDIAAAFHKGKIWFKVPESVKINIVGKLQQGVYAKDIILAVIKELTVNGATNMVIEFRGNIVDEMTMDERMTLSNMAVEAGATSGICLPDMTTVEYLWEFIKDDYSSRQEALETFTRFKSDDDAVYAKQKTIDVSNLSPLTTFGYKPDNVKPVSQMKGTKIDQVYIGSCTNGRLEDLKIAAKVLEGHTIASDVRAIVSPATPRIFSQTMEQGILKIFMDAGFCVTNPTCGACLGMSNGVLARGEVAAATTNRNFNGRMGKGGMVHLMSPATAAASAVKGEITNSILFKD